MTVTIVAEKRLHLKADSAPQREKAVDAEETPFIGDMAMAKAEETKPKKKRGILTLLKESMKRTSEGCGPGCGCHEEAKNEKKEGKANAAAKSDRK